MLLKLRIKSHSFLEEIITSISEVFKDFESDIVVGIRMLGNSTRATAKSIVTAQRIACA